MSFISLINDIQNLYKLTNDSRIKKLLVFAEASAHVKSFSRYLQDNKSRIPPLNNPYIVNAISELVKWMDKDQEYIRDGLPTDFETYKPLYAALRDTDSDLEVVRFFKPWLIRRGENVLDGVPPTSFDTFASDFENINQFYLDGKEEIEENAGKEGVLGEKEKNMYRQSYSQILQSLTKEIIASCQRRLSEIARNLEQLMAIPEAERAEEWNATQQALLQAQKIYTDFMSDLGSGKLSDPNYINWFWNLTPPSGSLIEEAKEIVSRQLPQMAGNINNMIQVIKMRAGHFVGSGPSWDDMIDKIIDTKGDVDFSIYMDPTNEDSARAPVREIAYQTTDDQNLNPYYLRMLSAILYFIYKQTL